MKNIFTYKEYHIINIAEMSRFFVENFSEFTIHVATSADKIFWTEIEILSSPIFKFGWASGTKVAKNFDKHP